jgi:hypothetical protein
MRVLDAHQLAELIDVIQPASQIRHYFILYPFAFYFLIFNFPSAPNAYHNRIAIRHRANGSAGIAILFDFAVPW